MSNVQVYTYFDMQNNRVPTTVYLSEEQRTQIQRLSLAMQTPKAELTRVIIDKGIAAVKQERTGSAQALLALAGLIATGSGLPPDLSERHNEYTWDE